MMAGQVSLDAVKGLKRLFDAVSEVYHKASHQHTPDDKCVQAGTAEARDKVRMGSVDDVLLQVMHCLYVLLD